MKRNVHRAIAEGVLRRDEAKEMLGNDDLGEGARTSDLLEMMQMTRDERRRLLEDSVAESVEDYDVDDDWVNASLEGTAV